eukprot:3097286-Rhodomonas_salina.1
MAGGRISPQHRNGTQNCKRSYKSTSAGEDQASGRPDKGADIHALTTLRAQRLALPRTVSCRFS